MAESKGLEFVDQVKSSTSNHNKYSGVMGLDFNLVLVSRIEHAFCRGEAAVLLIKRYHL